jgi:RNA polymerase sigma factor (sigma-70 family)
MSSEPLDSRDVRASVLWEEYRRSKSASARDRLIEHYTPLVHKVAEVMSRRLWPRVSVDVLADAGREGLIAAVSSFDPSRAVRFEMYCRQQIVAAIRDRQRDVTGLDPGEANFQQAEGFEPLEVLHETRIEPTRRFALLLRETRRTLEQIESALAEMCLKPGAGPSTVPKVPRLIQSEIDRLIDKGTESGLSEEERAQLDEALDYLDDLTIFELERLSAPHE